MTEEQHDKDQIDLNEYLDGQSPVSEAYRELERPEPPAALDRAILQAARDETARGGTFWPQWMKPLSVVAMLGVCLAIVLQVMYLPQRVTHDAFLMKDDSMLREERAQLLEMAPEQQPEAFDSLAEGKLEQSFAAAIQPAPVTEILDELDVAAPVRDERLEDITVTARKRSPGIAEVPLSITAHSSLSSGPGLEEMVVARREPESVTAKTAGADALDAWKAGIRPAEDVWIAGIRALYEEGENEWANEELAKMHRLYPAAVAADGILYEKVQDADQLSKAASNQAATISPQTPALSDLPDPDVWTAGIEWLYEQGETERADAELEKLGGIYPDYEY
jgi:tetratricopeptide (TPR) repeat protein